MRFLLLASALFASAAAFADAGSTPSPAPQSQHYGNPASCLHYTLPAKLRQLAVPATAAEAQASGLVAGQYGGVKPAGGGGVCTGEVFKINKPGLRIWRVFSRTRGQMGGWWSFDKSDDHYRTRASWRRDNAVCRDWNPAADAVFSCSLPKGELILVGPGQSAHCDDPAVNSGGTLDRNHYPASKTAQIYWNGWRRHTPNTKNCSAAMTIRRWTDAEGRGGSGAAGGSGSMRAPQP